MPRGKARAKAKYLITAEDVTKRAIRSVIRGFKSVGRAVFSLKSAIIGVVGVAGLGLLIKRSLEATDRVGKLSKTYGIATKELAAFQLAAELGGVSLDIFANSARRLSRNVFNFMLRGTGEIADAFKVLKISQDDLRPIMNDSVKLMGLLSDRLNEVEDGAVKAALGATILGARNVELLPALAGGSAQLEKYRMEVEQIGFAMEDRVVRGVENANDAVTRLKFLFVGVTRNLVAGFAPAIQATADTLREFFVNAAKGQGGIAKMGQSMGRVVLDGVRAVIQMIQQGVEMVKNFDGMRDSVLNFARSLGADLLQALQFTIKHVVELINEVKLLKGFLTFSPAEEVKLIDETNITRRLGRAEERLRVKQFGRNIPTGDLSGSIAGGFGPASPVSKGAIKLEKLLEKTNKLLESIDRKTRENEVATFG